MCVCVSALLGIFVITFVIIIVVVVAVVVVGAAAAVFIRPFENCTYLFDYLVEDERAYHVIPLSSVFCFELSSPSSSSSSMLQVLMPILWHQHSHTGTRLRHYLLNIYVFVYFDFSVKRMTSFACIASCRVFMIFVSQL